MKNEVKFLIALLSLVLVATLCRNFPTEDTFTETSAVKEPGENAGRGEEATPTYTIVPPDISGGEELEVTFTPTPEEAYVPDRCAIFDTIEMKFILYSLTTEELSLTMYVRMYGGVPGLELTIPGDPGPWEYYATLGALESVECKMEGYAERLYCYFALHPTYHNTAQPFNLYVNGCDEPIFGHPRLSIISFTPTPGMVADPCGPMPSTAACSTEFADWCSCKGGAYYCIHYLPPFTGTVPFCILPP